MKPQNITQAHISLCMDAACNPAAVTRYKPVECDGGFNGLVYSVSVHGDDVDLDDVYISYIIAAAVEKYSKHFDYMAAYPAAIRHELELHIAAAVGFFLESYGDHAYNGAAATVIDAGYIEDVVYEFFLHLL